MHSSNIPLLECVLNAATGAVRPPTMTGVERDALMVTWRGDTRSHAESWGLLPGSGLNLADGTCDAQSGGA
jgi:hypothetical protein